MDALVRGRSLLGRAAVAIVVTACSSQGATPVPTVGAQASSAAAASGSVYTVEVKQDASMGAYIVGEDGKTLYLLTKDSVGTSTCTAACATTWPPFVLQTGVTVAAGSGVTGMLATIKRPDGSDQVAINGIPLYYFSGDKAAGDTNGVGYKNIWFLVSPGGTAVGAAAASPAASPSASKSSGYGY